MSRTAVPELIARVEAAEALLRRAMVEAVPDAMLMAIHDDPARAQSFNGSLQAWLDAARSHLSAYGGEP